MRIAIQRLDLGWIKVRPELVGALKIGLQSEDWFWVGSDQNQSQLEQSEVDQKHPGVHRVGFSGTRIR